MGKKKNQNDFIPELSRKIKSLNEQIIEFAKQNSSIEDINIDGRDPSFPRRIVHLFVSRSYDGFEKLNETIDIVLDFFGENYSVNYLNGQITGIIIRTLNKENQINEEVTTFYNGLMENSNNEWFIFSEIDNIKLLDTTKLVLIGCKIKNMTLNDVPSNLQLREDNNWINISNKPCIFTKVIAGDHKKAIELAFQNFNYSFNLIRLYFPGCEPAIKGTIVTGHYEIYTYNQKTKNALTTKSISKNIYYKSLTLNSEIDLFLQGRGIDSLTKDNSITEVVKNCLHWYGNGLDDNLQSAKLLDFVTVLECSLKKKNEKTELKLRVADRCAFLLGKNYEERVKISQDISSIYNARSIIVHTGDMIKKRNWTRQAQYYANEVLQCLILKNSEYGGDFNLFIEEIDRNKYRA